MRMRTIILAEPLDALGRSVETLARLTSESGLDHHSLSDALVKLRRWPDAVTHSAEAVGLQPDLVERSQSWHG